MTSNFKSNSRRRGGNVCGLGGLALASVLLLCGAGNLPVENFTPQGPMQADLNIGGHNLTNAATINATNAIVGALNVATATAGTVNATNVTVSGALTASNFTLPFASVTSAPTTLAGYGITNAYTQAASDARYAPLAGSTNLTMVGAITTGSFPYANVTGNPITLAGGKTLAVNNTLILGGTDGSTLNVGTGGTLGSAAFAATSAFLAPAAIGTSVQAYNANTTTLGNAVNGANNLVQTDGTGLLVDAIQRTAGKLILVSQGMGNDTRTGLSKYSRQTPFATLTAAAAAAAAGDTIVVQDGVFTDKNLALATGVDWFFLPNAAVVVTGAANGDAIFKDNGTAVTAMLAGCGQIFSISGTASSATVSVLAVTGASNVTVQNLSFTASETALFSTTATLSSNNASAVINMTGNLLSTTTGAATSDCLMIGSSGGGTITINGSVTATTTGANAAAINCASSSTSSGTITVTGRVSSTYTGIFGSSTCLLTCGSLNDGSGASYVYNHLTLLGPIALVQTVAAPASGFSQTDTAGPQDHLIELTPTATLASGTIILPNDAVSRIGQRVTVTSTQTITSLTITVPSSGTLYGYSASSVGPGSITFQKIGSNTWVKL